MNDKKIDCYPWATPTEKQREYFDSLSDEEQFKMVQDAIIKGLESGVSSRSMTDILSDVKEKALKAQDA